MSREGVNPSLEGENDQLVIDEFTRFLLEFHARTRTMERASVGSVEDGVEEEEEEEEKKEAPHHLTRGKYFTALASMIDKEQTTIRVDFADIRRTHADLAQAIEVDYYRYERALREGAKQAAREVRREARERSGGDVTREDEAAEKRDIFVAFHLDDHAVKLRELRSEKIGRLVAARGTVTRTSDVRPELLVGTFTCLGTGCGLEARDVEQQLRYTTPTICTNPQCNNQQMKNWDLVVEKSKFVDWQRLRVQESPDEIPAGSLPRAFDVIVRDDQVEKAYAGDTIRCTGTLAVVPDSSGLARAGEAAVGQKGLSSSSAASEFAQGITGTKLLGSREMTYKLIFLACDIERVNAKNRYDDDDDFEDDDDEAEEDEVRDPEARRLDRLARRDAEVCERMRTTPQLYDALAASIAPSVYGHADIKRGILLQLVGGIHKVTTEGIKLRGDVNVCIVGDPSTAKSQFLKYVHNFMPRAVYTSGKAASAAGLTASVVRDQDTGEFCVEAGALMLADNGICCIDEFDKMDLTDQVAIHEAMEQQTISIAKAGIHANLNARAAILAAANPKHGRYDKTKTLKANVDMSAPIMSRFDLFFIVLDDCDEVTDRAVATHIVDVHRGSARVFTPPFNPADLATYIRCSRARTPKISDAAHVKLVACYKKLRANDVVGHSRTAYRITVRQLESLIRLSEAMAKIHMLDTVTPEHVDEAFRLLKKSIISVETDAVILDEMDDEPAIVEEDSSGAENNPDHQVDDDVRLLHLMMPKEEAEEKEKEEEEESSSSFFVRRESSEPSLEAMDGDAPGEDARAPTTNDDVAQRADAEDKAARRPEDDEPEPMPAPEAATKKVKLSYEDFQRYSGEIVLFLRKKEHAGIPGLRRSEIIAWYHAEHADVVGDDADGAHAKLVKLILKRLQKDETLIVVAAEDGEPVLAVHPNFSLH